MSMEITKMLKCSPENTEYLLGIERIGKMRGSVAAAVDAALADYPASNELIGALQHMLDRGNVSLAKAIIKVPHLMMVAFPEPRRNANNRFAVKHGFDGDNDDGIPRFKFSKLDASGQTKFRSVAPLGAILSDIASLEGTYTVYHHCLYDGISPPKNYVGITRKGWGPRYRQHLNAAKSGSPYLFHEALRRSNVTEVHSVLGLGLSYEVAMDLEGRLVDQLSLYPMRANGLNMIPGGFAGIRYLHKLGLKNIGPRQMEHRSALVRQAIKRAAREGKPNPWLAAMWRSDEFAASRICGNPNNLDLEQVREARLLADFGWSIEKIAERFVCSSERVRRLLRGSTYSRVH
jgi:hypothetical protein